MALLEEIIEIAYDYDAIVVEGYDGVGKGRVLTQLAEALNVIPYRPDYNLWQKYDHRTIDRWKVSGFFWDIFSHFGHHFDYPMLFDRGVISGAVYNNDTQIAQDYPRLLRDFRVLHIFVVCDKDDYIKFYKSRFPDADDIDTEGLWEEYRKYEMRYLECFQKSGVEYLFYKNEFNEELSKKLATTCAGCGHYNYGFCRHPKMNCRVVSNSARCELSSDKEVQDQYDSEVCSV